MVGYYNQAVPTSVDLENNSNQKKYTVNRPGGKGLVVSRPLCVLMAIGAILLAVLVGLVVFFLVPRCSEASVQNLTALSQKSAVDERLPKDIFPTHYRIRLIPSLENGTVSGSTTITLHVHEATNEIIFHLEDIVIDEKATMLKNLKTSKPGAIASQKYLEGYRYRIEVEDELVKGQDYLLDLSFVGKLNRHLQGFYGFEYDDYEDGKIVKRNGASTQFSPTNARKAFPCFDEPIFKAKFTISLARPKSMKTLSNMPLKKSEPVSRKPGWIWDHYQDTPEMSTYLVAFTLTDLVQATNNSMINIWTKNALTTHTHNANFLAPKLLKYFEDYFGIKFPLPKIDIVAVPEFGFNAMENWGLITFRESSLLYDVTTSTVEDQRQIALVLSHEIAHQWFGNLVTMKWWDDLWLKEGFATYLEYLGVNEQKPNWNILEEFLPSEIMKAMELDSLPSSRPISFSVKNSQEIKQTFDDISYAKGACLVRMMNNFLGEETFKKGLINYLEKYKYKSVDRNDLFKSLTEEAHRSGALEKNDSVKEIMDSWTEQAGFPVVTAIANYEKRKVTISQKRFFKTSSEDASTWWVPISIATDLKANFSDARPKHWLKKEKSIEIDLDISSWYLLNLNHTGYYIVNYDERNWRALIEHVMDLPPLTRAQLISNSMDLARANQLDYDIPLKLIARMAVQDTNIWFVPTLVAFEKLTFLNNILANKPAFGIFEDYHAEIFREPYRIVELDDSVDDYLTRRIRRTVLTWSCRSSDSKCSHESRQMFRDWMTTDNPVAPNLRNIVYCTAIREGSEAEWNFAYKKYKESEDPSERNVLLDALGCTRKTWLLSRYLENLVFRPSSINVQDADRVFKSVATNKMGSALAFDFLRSNFHQLQEHFGDGFRILAKMIDSVSTYMNSEFELTEFERFKESVSQNSTVASQAFDNAIENIRANVEWMKKNYESVAKWLAAHKHNYGY